MKKKILLGMSGGVDSSLSAMLLIEQGYDVTGITFVFHSPQSELANKEYKSKDAEDAKKLAQKLGIDHIVMDLRQDFDNLVVTNFVTGYENGITPNPCVYCNKNMKFKTLYDLAVEKGFDHIATGHYSRVLKNEDTGRYAIQKSVNPQKDQSYVLYTLDQEVLKMLVFPLGAQNNKEDVRKEAKEKGIEVFDKPDSQDICFIPKDIDYEEYLVQHAINGSKKGSFVDMDGQKLGDHCGICSYTVGQRKGLGQSFGKRLFVKSINAQNGEVVLCEDPELFENTLYVEDVYWQAADEDMLPFTSDVRVRYAHKGSRALVEKAEGNMLKITFESPQRAITPGQSAVFYKADENGDYILGGGTIVTSENI